MKLRRIVSTAILAGAAILAAPVATTQPAHAVARTACWYIQEGTTVTITGTPGVAAVNARGIYRQAIIGRSFQATVQVPANAPVRSVRVQLSECKPLA